jgi:hypothetical protein
MGEQTQPGFLRFSLGLSLLVWVSPGCTPEANSAVEYIAVPNQPVASTNTPNAKRTSSLRSVGTPRNLGQHGDIKPQQPASNREVNWTNQIRDSWDRLQGLQSLSKFGHSVSEAGDINADGFDDVVIGAPGSGRDKAGSVHLYFGGSQAISTVPNWTYLSKTPQAELGHQVAGVGDVNGDGYDDLLIGATYGADPGRVERTGSAMVFHGGPEGPSHQPDWQVFGTATGDNTGFSVGAAGDVNGDGFYDVLVGSWNAENDPRIKDGRNGAAALYLGSPSGLTKVAAWRPEGEKHASHFGYPLHGLGDVNGDGYDDIAIGAWGFESEKPECGRVDVYMGGPSGPLTMPSWVLSGVRRSGTRAIRLGIRVEATELWIEIVDFGSGFKKGKVSGRGHGLQNINNRLERHGGRANIKSGNGGTEVSLHMPIRSFRFHS